MGTPLVSGTFDNTASHEYLLDWVSNTSWRIFRDGVLVHSGSGGFALASNRVLFGDGTGGSNARGEITAFRFIQNVPTATETGRGDESRALYRWQAAEKLIPRPLLAGTSLTGGLLRPLHGAAQAFAERHLRLPSQPFGRT